MKLVHWKSFSTIRFMNRLRVFENRVLRRIFAPKREKLLVGWRREHNEELHKLYTSPNIIWAGHVARMGEMKNAYNILVGKPEGHKPLAIPWHRWEDNIRMDRREIGCEDVDWMHPYQGTDQCRAVVNTVNLWVA
jgi:hypothetical protein